MHHGPFSFASGKATPHGVSIGIKTDDAVSKTRQDVIAQHRFDESYTLSYAI
jgi:hypothetical protein